MSTPDWCAKHIRIPAETGATPGRYNLRDYPYWVDVLADFDRPEVEVIVLMCATQVGKTTLLQAALAAQTQNDPAPSMLAGPDQDNVLEFRDKFYSMCEASPATRKQVPPRYRRNDRWIEVGSNRCHLGWSGNPQRLGGKSCKYVFCTELDNWKTLPRVGSSAKLVANRVKAFYRYKILYESTPTNQDSAIARLYETSDKQRYHVPCPHCGEYQELRFFPHREGPKAGRGGVAGLKDSEGNWLPAEAARDAAYYVCEHCGEAITDRHKPGMIRAGKWCPEGCTVDQSGVVSGLGGKPARVRGRHLSSIYSLTITFGRMAEAYLRARGSEKDLQDFFNGWLALPYSQAHRTPKWRHLARRLSGAVQRQVVPASAIFLTAGVDVQKDSVYWIVRAWGDGFTSWLVDWGQCLKRLDADGSAIEGSHLAQLDDVILNRVFPLAAENPHGMKQLKVARIGIDTGYRSHEVHAYARQRAPRVITVAGDHALSRSEPFRMTVVERSARTGKIYPGGMKRWGINTVIYKEEIQARWDAQIDRPGAWLLYRDPINDAETYLRQIVNEAPVPGRNKQGRPVIRWTVIDESVGNHYWDCEVYAFALAEMITGCQREGIATLLGRPSGGEQSTAKKTQEKRNPGVSRHDRPGGWTQR